MGFGFDAGEMEVNKSKVHWGTYQLVDVSVDVILRHSLAPPPTCAQILRSSQNITLLCNPRSRQTLWRKARKAMKRYYVTSWRLVLSGPLCCISLL